MDQRLTQGGRGDYCASVSVLPSKSIGLYSGNAMSQCSTSKKSFPGVPLSVGRSLPLATGLLGCWRCLLLVPVFRCSVC